ncbi:hypothetical protein PHLCEN_2v3048 [Hermanssonia centrifuga]|uniref:UBC core domain-containing protein n=1 Tax=Hermanssonia centrifuga TaxID=98765 RepID=A0A2R6R769_9APHY|nr:hypothetical protein PHLCEN_2v3048 [Hermanssonia centrifuga]
MASTAPANTPYNTLLLRRQLAELTKHPVDGFSAGAVDIPYTAPIVQTVIDSIIPNEKALSMTITCTNGSEGGFFKARLSFPEDFPLSPPKLRFITPMWHPNIYSDGNVCISILHPPGEDQYGFEESGERWLPVHTVESILLSVISLLSSDRPNTDSPANVDAAKEIRESFDSTTFALNLCPLACADLSSYTTAYKKKVRRLVRRSAEEAFD